MTHHAPVEGERPLRDAHRTRRAAAAWALTVLALSATVQSASAAERSDSVLVRVDPAAPAAERADVRAALDADGVRPLVAGWRAYALPSDVTLAQARRLLDDEPAVRAVELDGRLHATEIPDDAYYGSQWALPAIGAPASWDATTGAGQVTVAVIDTGVQTSHPDLAGRLWQNPGEVVNGIDDDGNGRVDDVHGWNFYDDTSVLYSATDGDSHGTHVAGTVAATRNNAIGVAGVSHNARIMPLKFLKPGGGYTSDAIVAIQYAVAEGADVINASWGGESYSQPLCDAIALAGDAGVLFVAAAGNGGDDGVGDDNDAVGNWPTNCPSSNVVAVAATTELDGLTSFSNYGAATVDIGAPGDDILSTVPGGYGWKSGTSMAAPHVSGVAAVVLGMHPALVPWQVRAALTGGGVPVPALAGRTTSGRRLSMSGALTVAGTGIGPDVTPPDAFSAIAPADGHSTASPASSVFTWNATGDGGSGISSYRLVLDGRQVAATGPSARSAAYAVEDGVHTWAVVARDAAGNERSTPSRTLTVDRTPPSAPVPQSPAAGGKVPGPLVDLSWAASRDALTGVASYRVLVDGVAVATVPGTATSARVSMTRAAHNWQVIAIDGLGNQAASAARSVTVTATVPALGTGPSSSRRLTLVAPARLASGATPALRVRVPSPMAVTVSVRRSDRVKPIGSFRVRARRGLTTIRFPRSVSTRMRARGTYVISARASAALRDTVRITVGPRRR